MSSKIFRIEKVAYEMAKMKNHSKQEKTTSVKNMNQLTSWIKVRLMNIFVGRLKFIQLYNLLRK